MDRVINIANDFTKTPGGRHIEEGPFSGEEFREKILFPAFQEVIKERGTLTVNLDGGYGYGSSFLEEAFGGLARKTKDRRVLQITIVSEEEPRLVEDVKGYMEEALNG